MTRDEVLAEAIVALKLLPTESVAALIPVLERYAGIDLMEALKCNAPPLRLVPLLEPVA